MFARITPIVLALFALASTAVAADSCQSVCCKSAGNAPSGWQGSDCTPVQAGGTCSYTQLCCWNVEGSSASSCSKTN
ncbi:hypothetical protein HYDPIDRAFT_104570 [Hydnomerulius pinastri MD-312]|nr:hypothetical protein HYDPIDRAFT_104570 [Hydnomerulius pinastri MD-312]